MTETPTPDAGSSDAGSSDAGSPQLKRRARLAVIFLGARSALQTLIRIPAMIYLARTLSPMDFGVFALLQFAMSFLRTVGDGGLGAALLQRKEPPAQTELSSVFWTQLGIAGGLVFLLGAIAPFFSQHFDLGEGGVSLLRAFSFTFFFTLARSVPTLLLERKVDFGWVGTIEFFGSMANYAAACVGAAMGYGTEALVLGVLLETGLMAVLAFGITRWRPSLFFDWGQVRPILAFGLNFQGIHLLGFINQAVSPILLGLGPGAAALGLVNFARTTAESPAELIGLVRRVAFPYLSRLQDQPKLFAAEFNRAIAASAMPTYFFLALFMVAGSEIVNLVYAPKWMPALLALQVFSAILSVSFFGWIASAALDAIGDARVLFLYTALSVSITWAATATATFLWPTPEGFAMGFAVQVPLGMFLMYRRLRVRGYPVTPVRATLPSAVAGGLLILAGRGLDGLTHAQRAVGAALQAALGPGADEIAQYQPHIALGLGVLVAAPIFLGVVAALDPQLRAWLQARWRQRRQAAAS